MYLFPILITPFRQFEYFEIKKYVLLEHSYVDDPISRLKMEELTLEKGQESKVEFSELIQAEKTTGPNITHTGVQKTYNM